MELEKLKKHLDEGKNMTHHEMYSEIILDLYKRPHNRGRMEKYTVHIEGGNPTCGDQVKYDVLIEKDVLKDIKYEGDGCAISNAGMSVLTDLVKGKTVEEVLKLESEDLFNELGNIVQTRLKCGLVSLSILQQGLSEWKKNGKKELVGFKI